MDYTWDTTSTLVLIGMIAVFAVGAFFIRKLNKARPVGPKK